MTQKPFWAHATAIIDQPATIGDNTKVWHFAHVMSGAKIGSGCSLGQNVYVGATAVVGNGCKIQNNVSLYTGAIVEDDVFLGPSCVLTNVTNPRSQVARKSLYETTRLRRGATVGANATVVCGVTLGRYCFVAAGAVVTRDVPDYALVLGVPAGRVGWMSRHGHRLTGCEGEVLICPQSHWRYREVSPGVLTCLDRRADEPLGE